MTTTENDCVYLARTPEAQGYWATHKDGPHHAIASCCGEGANASGIFIVYRGCPGMRCDPVWGQITWPADQPEPELEGVFTARGEWLDENLGALAKQVQKGHALLEEEYGIDRRVIKALKDYKPE